MRSKAFLLIALLLPLALGAESPSPTPAQPALPAQPARPAQPRPLRIPDDVQLVRDVVYGKGGERDLKLDIVRPSASQAPGGLAPMPVIVFVHGGGWEGGNKEGPVAQLIPFAQKGYFCASIEYRLSGEAVWPAQIEDCKCAIRFLRAKAGEYGIDPKRIGVWGASAGGHLVAMLGTAGDAKELEGKGGWPDQSSRVQAVCDWFGPADLTWIARQAEGGVLGRPNNPVSRLLGGPAADLPEKARQASPVTYITPDDPPFLIMHGDKDPLVPLAQSVGLRNALEKAKVEVTLEVVKGAGHGFGSPELTGMVMDFFDSHLAAKPAPAGASKEPQPAGAKPAE